MIDLDRPTTIAVRALQADAAPVPRAEQVVPAAVADHRRSLDGVQRDLAVEQVRAGGVGGALARRPLQLHHLDPAPVGAEHQPRRARGVLDDVGVDGVEVARGQRADDLALVDPAVAGRLRVERRVRGQRDHGVVVAQRRDRVVEVVRAAVLDDLRRPHGVRVGHDVGDPLRDRGPHGAEVAPRAAVVDGLADLHGAAVLARVARGVDEPLTGARALRERGVVQRDVAAQLSDDRGGRGWLVGRGRGRRQCGHGHADEEEQGNGHPQEAEQTHGSGSPSRYAGSAPVARARVIPSVPSAPHDTRCTPLSLKADLPPPRRRRGRRAGRRSPRGRRTVEDDHSGGTA